MRGEPEHHEQLSEAWWTGCPNSCANHSENQIRKCLGIGFALHPIQIEDELSGLLGLWRRRQRLVEIPSAVRPGGPGAPNMGARSTAPRTREPRGELSRPVFALIGRARRCSTGRTVAVPIGECRRREGT